MDWEKIKKSFVDGATLSMEKIEEYTKIGKLKIDEISAKRKIERNYSDIGERVFDLIESDSGDTIKEDLAIKSSIDNIKELKEELVQLSEKINEVQEEYRREPEEDDEDDTNTGV